MDIVYVVGENERNESLKYSLRSLKNIPHDDVYIIGHKPAWVKNVKYVNRIQRVRNKFQNIFNTQSNKKYLSKINYKMPL